MFVCVYINLPVCVLAKDNPVGDHMVFICLKTGETVFFSFVSCAYSNKGLSVYIFKKLGSSTYARSEELFCVRHNLN